MTWPTKTDFVTGDVLTAAQINNIGTNLNLADPTLATVGQILMADGAGSMAFQDPGASGGLTNLGSFNIRSSTSVTISNLVTTDYPLLYIPFQVAQSQTGSYYGTYLKFNGLTSGYTYNGMYGSSNYQSANQTRIQIGGYYSSSARRGFILMVNRSDMTMNGVIGMWNQENWYNDTTPRMDFTFFGLANTGTVTSMTWETSPAFSSSFGNMIVYGLS